MASTTSRGNYYKRKTRDWFIKRGYTTQLTEFTSMRPIGNGKVIWTKKDVFGADGISMNGEEIIFWNAKSVALGTNTVRNEKSRAKVEFAKYPFPPCVKLQAIIWEPKKQPVVVNYNDIQP